MLFTMNLLAECFPEHRGSFQLATEIKVVVTDSRKQTENSLFIPIAGERFDGHEFAPQAIDNGAKAILWQKDRELPEGIRDDFPIFYTEDTVKGMQELAYAYRQLVDPIVVGITGSNGKTTTKDLVAQVAATTYRTHCTNGNFNNHIGLPLTILSMDNQTEVLILEMGMSQFGEIEVLSTIARPDYAIITNIGESHIEFLGSREGIATAKKEIMAGLKLPSKRQLTSMIIDGDEALLHDLHPLEYVKKCGFKEDNDVTIKNTEVGLNGTSFTLSGVTYTVPLLGRHHALNAAFAAVIGELLHINEQRIQEAFDKLKQTAMRFQMLQGPHGVTIINDAYNASPTSMKAAIDVLKELTGFKEKVVVLGDILELGENAEAFHREIAASITSPITAVFTLGEYAAAISDALSEKNSSIAIRHFTKKEELVLALKAFLRKDVCILFKASRSMQFENIIKEIINLKK